MAVALGSNCASPAFISLSTLVLCVGVASPSENCRSGVIDACPRSRRSSTTSSRPRRNRFAIPTSRLRACSWTTRLMHPIGSVSTTRAGWARVSLDDEGFALVKHRSAVRNFYDDDEVRRVYYPEAAERLTDRSHGCGEGARLRSHRASQRAEQSTDLDSGRPSADGMRGPVGQRAQRLHRTIGANARLRRELGAEADELLDLRFCSGERLAARSAGRCWMRRSPFAMRAALRSMIFVPSDLIYRDRTGETYAVKYNPAHRWFYVSALAARRSAAAQVLRLGRGRSPRASRRTRAFEDPTTPPNAPPRESIELRSFVFYPD